MINIQPTTTFSHRQIARAQETFRRSVRQRLRFWRGFAPLMRAQHTASEAVEILWSDFSLLGTAADRAEAVTMAAAIQPLKNGDTLSSALRNALTQRELLLLQSGEKANKLPETADAIFEFESKYERRSAEIRAKMRTPMIVAAIQWATMVYTIKIMTVGATKTPAQGWIGFLTKFSLFFYNWLSWIVPIIAVISVIVLIYALPRWTGPLRDRLDRSPWAFVFPLYRLWSETITLQSLAMLQTSGLDTQAALANIRAFSGPYIRYHIEAFAPHTRSLALGEAYARNGRGLFSITTRSRLLVADRANDLSAALRALARDAEFTLDDNMQAATETIDWAANVLNGLIALLSMIPMIALMRTH